MSRINGLSVSERKVALESDESLMLKAKKVAKELFGIHEDLLGDKLEADEEIKEHEKLQSKDAELKGGVELTVD